MQQKETDFKPTAAMMKVLNAAINPDVAPSISAWFEESGVSRSQWYRWQELPGFTQWFNDEYKKSFEGMRASLVKVGRQKAMEGDFQFWKVLMEKSGEYIPQGKMTLKEEKEAQCFEVTITEYGTEEVREIVHSCANINHKQGIIWKKTDDPKYNQVIKKVGP